MTFEEFVADHGQSLLRLAFVLTGDRHLAEDLTQTALADAYRHWRKVAAARTPESYVRRMLVNAHLSWQRRRWTSERPAELGDAWGGILGDPGDETVARAVTVDWFPPGQFNSATDFELASYGVGSRLLVSGEPRLGGAALDAATAWSCGFTRHYDAQTAAEWAAATR